MNNRTELIRREIMIQAYGFRPQARDANRIALFARSDGDLPDANTGEIDREADYLVGLGYLLAERGDLAASHMRYRITSTGIRWIEAEGLA